jgi:hypothetical protein
MRGEISEAEYWQDILTLAKEAKGRGFAIAIFLTKSLLAVKKPGQIIREVKACWA